MLKALKQRQFLPYLWRSIQKPSVQYILALLMVAVLAALIAWRLLVVSNTAYLTDAALWDAKQDQAVQQYDGNSLRMSVGKDGRNAA